MNTDEHKLARLAERHGPRVIAYLQRRTTNGEDAADVFQTVLEVTWRRLDAVPQEDSAALAWMLAVARRCLANHRRAHARRSAATERLAGELAVRIQADTAEQHQPDSPDSRSGPDSKLERALMQLSDRDRELLTLVYWDDLPVEHASKVLGIRPAAGRKRLQRARERLRFKITDGTLELSSVAPTPELLTE